MILVGYRTSKTMSSVRWIQPSSSKRISRTDSSRTPSSSSSRYPYRPIVNSQNPKTSLKPLTPRGFKPNNPNPRANLQPRLWNMSTRTTCQDMSPPQEMRRIYISRPCRLGTRIRCMVIKGEIGSMAMGEIFKESQWGMVMEMRGMGRVVWSVLMRRVRSLTTIMWNLKERTGMIMFRRLGAVTWRSPTSHCIDLHKRCILAWMSHKRSYLRQRAKTITTGDNLSHRSINKSITLIHS